MHFYINFADIIYQLYLIAELGGTVHTVVIKRDQNYQGG